MNGAVLSIALRSQHDVVMVRQRARQLAALLGFDEHDQTRIATAVSEIARNAVQYAGGGTVEFLVEGQSAPQLLTVKVSDRGRGIRDLKAVLEGRDRSSSGMGLGIVGARRLMDQFHVESAPGGTTVWLRKLFPRRAGVVGARDVAAIVEELGRQRPETPLEEVQRQNQELLRTLDELRERQDELTRVNRDLEDTNRGVVALYTELDEKADHLRRADDMKTLFLSNMSHEFRTPLNSILALSRLLLDRTDGTLTAEQERQVRYVRKAADDLSELVNDLLDLAKVEAGKIVVRPVEFEAASLFGALRGMLRPLLVNESVGLVFEDPEGVPPLSTDEAKVSQILRNFVSNALKFTERGDVRVSARLTPDGDMVVFSVSDTGIGIAPEDQERVFEAFTQLESPAQQRVKGTGLGLPLTRKLAGLLGGRVAVDSTPGTGSTFSATIPVVYREPAPLEGQGPAPGWELESGRRVPRVLVVDDDEIARYLLRGVLGELRCQVIEAADGAEGLRLARETRPDAVLLDLVMPVMGGVEVLERLAGDPATRDIPVVIVTSQALDDDRRRQLLTHAVAIVSKQTSSRDTAAVEIRLALQMAGMEVA